METIIGLLFLLLPVIFKLIGKRLEQAGKVDQAKTVQEIIDALGGEKDDVQPESTFYEEGEPAVSPESEVKPRPIPARKPIVIPVAKAQPMLMEENEEKGEKIDPKKLVIYSEIMKTKF